MKKYKIIYADPPWRYARSKVQGAAEKHYPTMSIEELCALPVKEIADKDCILFLWATFPQLKEALQLIKAWDLPIIRCLCMVKAKIGIAHLVLWLGLLDARKCGNLLACYQRTPEATIKQGTSIYYFPC